MARLLWALSVVCGGASADESNAVVGCWANPESILQVSRVGDGLSMSVVALLEPLYSDGEEFGPVGTPRRDHRNPDPGKRHVPIIGLELLSDYVFDSGKWHGRIYDPESGKTYASSMVLGKNGRLKMRGYIGLPMFGRTATFTPLPRKSRSTSCS